MHSLDVIEKLERSRRATRHFKRAPVAVLASAQVLCFSTAFVRGQATPAVPEPVPLAADAHPQATPSVADIFDKLEAFSPLPPSEVHREIKHTFWTNRVRLALNLGALVAEGFLVVQDRDRNRIVPLERELLRRGRALGIGQALIPYGQSILEHGEHNEWGALRGELISAQSDVERTLAALHDSDMALLVELGGWLRGLECASSATVARYTPARAAAIANSDALHYYIRQLDAIDPALREPLVIKIALQVRAIAALLDKPSPVTEAEAGRVYKICADLNAAIAEPDDA